MLHRIIAWHRLPFSSLFFVFFFPGIDVLCGELNLGGLRLPVRIDRWPDEWMCGWMDICVDEWMNLWVAEWVGLWMDVWVGG